MKRYHEKPNCRKLLVLSALWALSGGIAQASESAFGGLPEGPGQAEVFGYCSACHSLMLVQQQGLSHKAWQDTLQWMIEEQGMPEPPQETLELMTDYLATHYGIDGIDEAEQ